ncbi:unknown protein (plasmid) [Planktothrix agardhii NIES-204]|jgi:hypothetical protein|nr:unknown protein [Planktothrix agardhii NIES-204]
MNQKKLSDSKYFGIYLGIFFLALLVLFVTFLMNKEPDSIIIKQYISLLRMPIIAGLMLFFFPIIAIKIINNLLGNLFVMRGVGQLITVLGFSIGTAAMIVCSFNFIVINASERFNIEPLSTIFNINGLNLDLLSLISVIILASPTWIFTILLTLCDWGIISQNYCQCNPDKLNKLNLNQKFQNEIKVGNKNRQNEIKYSVIGTSLILVLTIILIVVLYNQIEFIYPTNLYPLNLNNSYQFEKKLDFDGIGNNPEYASEFLSLFIVGWVVYLLGFLLFDPRKINDGDKPLKNLTERRSAPALFYFLLMVWVLTGFFSGLSFWTDFWHLPITLIIVSLSGCLYLIFSIDNFFELKIPKSVTEKDYPKDEMNEEQLKDYFKKIIKKRLEKSNNKTLVVVATSGGGIQASGWTAKVLCGLQKELGESFTQSIGLISAVSGGSVGTMFFLDQFDKNKCPLDQPSLDNIFKNATEDWLDAVGWGIAYPDMIKFFGLNLFGRYSDRGYSLEWYWQKQLKNPKYTLADWKKDVEKGIIPIPVFNGTLLEDGRRFLISPIQFQNSTNENMKAVDFQTLYKTLYKDYDLDVTTAARLSASFPYVSPSPRPDIPSPANIYHIADGGYFDNFGTFTAIEWLDQNIENLMNGSIVERVIFIQINHFPTENDNPKKEQKGFPGWFTELIGPLLTLFNIKDSTQIARNYQELKLIQSKIELIQYKIDNKQNELKNSKIEDAFHSFTITFTGKNAPLSWYLTNRQIDDLNTEWNEYDAKKLRDLWNRIK